jgi:hypothetical protein
MIINDIGKSVRRAFLNGLDFVGSFFRSCFNVILLRRSIMNYANYERVQILTENY